MRAPPSRWACPWSFRMWSWASIANPVKPVVCTWPSCCATTTWPPPKKTAPTCAPISVPGVCAGNCTPNLSPGLSCGMVTQAPPAPSPNPPCKRFLKPGCPTCRGLVSHVSMSGRWPAMTRRPNGSRAACTKKHWCRHAWRMITPASTPISNCTRMASRALCCSRMGCLRVNWDA